MLSKSMLFFASFFLFTSCGEDEDSQSFSPFINAPRLAPIVSEALPAALQPGSSVNLNQLALSAEEDAATYITGMFKNTYGGISGTSAEGYINTQLIDLDSRIEEMAIRTADSSMGRVCWDEEPNDFTADATAINPILSIDLKVNCQDLFGDEDESGDGSGLVFGKSSDEEDFYAWLTLYQSNGTDVFGYMGGVQNAESESDREVDYMFLENFPQFDRVTATRLYAKPSTNSFEMHYASSNANIAGPDATNPAVLGCGFKMVSDGDFIYASGLLPQADSESGPDEYVCGEEPEEFEVCLNAEDLSASDLASCGVGESGGLDEAFRFDSSEDLLDQDDVDAETAAAAAEAAINIRSVDDLTKPFNEENPDE